jgi:serine O-acetyltransferase
MAFSRMSGEWVLVFLAPEGVERGGRMSLELGQLNPSGGFVETEDLAGVVSGLGDARREWREKHGRKRERGGRELPSRKVLGFVMESLSAALFPMRLGPPDLRAESEDFFVGHTLDLALGALAHQVRLELAYAANREGKTEGGLDERAGRIVKEFAESLPDIRRTLDSDVWAAYQGDPAARSVDEVLLCYPGIRAVIHYRLANRLYLAGASLLARMIADIAHSDTGIDIHPGAQIGSGFFIDHGTGVVVGETTVIGERVRLYQAVTLGAKRFPVKESGELVKGLLRHPVVEDDVVIYAGATILGRITIGKGSVIGGNVWLTQSVPPGSTVTQANVLQEEMEDGSGI